MEGWQCHIHIKVLGASLAPPCLKTIKHTVSSVCNALPCTPPSLPSAHLTHFSTSHHPFILARLRTGIWLSGQDRSCTMGSQKTNKMKLSSFLKSIIAINCCCSVTRSCLTLQAYGLWHTRLPSPSPSAGVCSNSCPLISDASNHLILWTPSPPSCLQSFPASGSFPMSQFFASGDQRIRASVSLLPMTIQDWFPLGLTGLISLLSKGPSRVFSSSTVQKHQFFEIQPFLWSNSHIHTWLLEKP